MIPNASIVADNGGIVFHGSITAGIDDKYTDLDMWLIINSNTYSDFIAKNGHFFDFEIEKKWGHINIENLELFKHRVLNCDFPLIYELRNSYFIQGNKDVLSVYKTSQKEIRKEITENHFLYNYALARNWQKSLENVLRRDDKVSLLLTISRFIEYTLKAAIIINREPYPYKKWLHYAANKIDSCSSLVNEIYLLIDIIEQKGFLGDKKDIEDNVLFKSMENIKISLKDLATQNNIESPIIEKWYLYIEQIDNLIKDKTFN